MRRWPLYRDYVHETEVRRAILKRIGERRAIARRIRAGRVSTREAQDGDWTIEATGYMGSRTYVGRMGGGPGYPPLGDFHPDVNVYPLILREMEREQFWPDVWHVSDHGNVTCITDQVFAAGRTQDQQEQDQ